MRDEQDFGYFADEAIYNMMMEQMEDDAYQEMRMVEAMQNEGE